MADENDVTTNETNSDVEQTSEPYVLSAHKINRVNRRITLVRRGETYFSYLDGDTLFNALDASELRFFREGDENISLTNEVLLAVVMDRLQQWQAGPHACPENHQALRAIDSALGALARRAAREGE